MSEYHYMVQKIEDFLHQNKINFKSFEHEAVRTSEEAAAIRPEYSISQGAKALLVRIKLKGVPRDQEKQFVQIVVPGDSKFNTKKARQTIGAKDIRFATEEEVNNLTDGIKPGGVPPFANLFGLAVFVEASLLKNEEIIFNAGDRRYSIALKSKDYLKVVKPTVLNIV